jgi:hypothetical protein
VKDAASLELGFFRNVGNYCGNVHCYKKNASILYIVMLDNSTEIPGITEKSDYTFGKESMSTTR